MLFIISKYTGATFQQIEKISDVAISRLAAIQQLTIAFPEAICQRFPYLLPSSLQGSDFMTSRFCSPDRPAVAPAALCTYTPHQSTSCHSCLMSGRRAVEKTLLQECADMRLAPACYDNRSAGRFGYLAKSPYRGAVNRPIAEVRVGHIDEIYIALPMIARKRIHHFQLPAVRDHSPGLYRSRSLFLCYPSLPATEIGNIQAISIFSSPFNRLGALTKRSEDRLPGTLIMLFSTPLCYRLR
ncbi:hypothetical protein ACM3CZ_15085 [Edwardsiella ictaluri]|uniref:hypothetical protein n=2 Tax=Edwardsiella ictaluri TaxID=67780 RepID=UPI0039F6961F